MYNVPNYTIGGVLMHSAKGTEWGNHKYVDKVKTKSGKWRYIYGNTVSKAKRSGSKVLNKLTGYQYKKQAKEFDARAEEARKKLWPEDGKGGQGDYRPYQNDDARKISRGLESFHKNYSTARRLEEKADHDTVIGFLKNDLPERAANVINDVDYKVQEALDNTVRKEKQKKVQEYNKWVQDQYNNMQSRNMSSIIKVEVPTLHRIGTYEMRNNKDLDEYIKESKEYNQKVIDEYNDKVKKEKERRRKMGFSVD